jgi:hypothetical protein
MQMEVRMVKISLSCALMVALLFVVPSCTDSRTTEPSEDPQRVESVETQSFAAGDTIRVVVDDFVGSITVKPGTSDSVRVVATKYAQDSLVITATNPLNFSNAGVDLDITAPPDARFTVINGVGNLIYEGRPKGAHSYDVGVGNIICFWPADVNVTINVRVQVGTLNIEFPVNYTSSPTMRSVEGTISSGDEGSVRALVPVGEIHLRRQ